MEKRALYRPLIFVGAKVLFFTAIITSCASHPILSNREKLCWFTPDAESLNNNAVVKGKIIVVHRSSKFEKGKYGECDLDGFSNTDFNNDPVYFPSEMYASTPEEIDSLVMIEIKKGKFLESAIGRESISRNSEVDIFSGISEISLIDYKSSTVVRKIFREDSAIPKNVPTHRLKLVQSPGRQNYEYVIEPSPDDLRASLNELSNRIKTQ